MPIQNDRPVAVTIGWELEAIAAPNQVPEAVEGLHDGSVRGEGREYRVRREYVDDHGYSLNSLVRLASDERLNVDRSCGFHVHIGIPSLSMSQKRQWALFFYELGRHVQNAAFSAVPPSRRQNRYCEALQPSNFPIGYWDQLRPPNRYQWVNISNLFINGEIETVEVRLLGSTRRPAYLLAWVAACVAMGKASYRLLFDPTRMGYEVSMLQTVFRQVGDAFITNRNDTSNHWNVAETLLRQFGLPIPAGPRVAVQDPVTVQRIRRAVVPTPIEITDEILRQAQSFTLSPVQA